MKIIAAILILLAFVVGIVPHYTDCASQGRAIELPNGKTVAMKCHWTGEAELALAAPLVLLGVLEFINNQRRDVLIAMSILGIAVGIFVVLLPTALIGVCANPDMLCNSVMRPTLIFSGVLVAGLSIVGLVLAIRMPQSTVKLEIKE